MVSIIPLPLSISNGTVFWNDGIGVSIPNFFAKLKESGLPFLPNFLMDLVRRKC